MPYKKQNSKYGENVFRIETLISLILISLGIAFVNMNLKKSGGKI